MKNRWSEGGKGGFPTLNSAVFDAESFDTGCIAGAIWGVGAGLPLAFVAFAATKKGHGAGVVAAGHHGALSAPKAAKTGRAVAFVAALVDA